MDPLQLIVTGGAAGALFWVLKLFADGKFHTSSEVDGLRADKVRLVEANQRLEQSIGDANKGLAEILRILRGGEE